MGGGRSYCELLTAVRSAVACSTTVAATAVRAAVAWAIAAVSRVFFTRFGDVHR